MGRARGAVMGLEPAGGSCPRLAPGWGPQTRGSLLVPGVQESQACGPEPMFPQIGHPPQGWEAGWGLNSDMDL